MEWMARIAIVLHMRTNGDIQRVADVIGTDAALQLADAFAGQRIYFPKGKVSTVREYIRQHPDAPPFTVIDACQCSRSTYYRVKNETSRGN